jgi:hypothetical protein
VQYIYEYRYAQDAPRRRPAVPEQCRSESRGHTPARSRGTGSAARRPPPPGYSARTVSPGPPSRCARGTANFGGYSVTGDEYEPLREPPARAGHHVVYSDARLARHPEIADDHVPCLTQDTQAPADPSPASSTTHPTPRCWTDRRTAPSSSMRSTRRPPPRGRRSRLEVVLDRSRSICRRSRNGSATTNRAPPLLPNRGRSRRPGYRDGAARWPRDREPEPGPFSSALRGEEGSKIRSSCSGGMPGPLSCTTNSSSCPRTRA